MIKMLLKFNMNLSKNNSKECTYYFKTMNNKKQNLSQSDNKKTN